MSFSTVNSFSILMIQCFPIYLLMYLDEDCAVDFIYTPDISLIGNFWIICAALPIFIPSVMDIKTVFS